MNTEMNYPWHVYKKHLVALSCVTALAAFSLVARPAFAEEVKASDTNAKTEVVAPAIENVVAISIKAPNLIIQKKISNILQSLDEKIELNCRINENLEQQAQALSIAKLQVLPLILQLFLKQLNPLQRLQVQLSLKQIQQDQKYLLLKQELQ
jgi:hypothetical protein